MKTKIELERKLKELQNQYEETTSRDTQDKLIAKMGKLVDLIHLN